MFSKLRRARADLTTMNALFPAAERMARDDGTEQPGAEHLLLAALDLDDGIAQEVLDTFDVDPARLRAAIASQHDETLRAIGVIADDNAIAAALPASCLPTGPYLTQGSAQTAFQHAVALAKRSKANLNSGHLLLATTDSEHGTVARSLHHLSVDRDLLRNRTCEMLAK